MKVNMNLGSKQNKEAFNDYFGEDMLFGNISTLSEWVYMQKLPVHHKPLIAIKINHNKQAFKLSERANDLSQLFDTLPDELNSIYSDYVEFNFSQKLKGMLTITVDWSHYLANLDQMNVDNSSFTDSLLKIEQFHNALNNLANEITPETKDSLTKQDAVDQTSDLDGFDDSTKQSEDDNMKELTQIAHANETGNSLPETENSQDANDLSNSDELNDSEMPDSAQTTQTTDNNPVKPEDNSTEDDDSTASDDANHETFDSTQTNTEPETADKETGDSDNDESSDDNSENPENRYVKLSSEKFDHMIELLDNLVTSKTETKPDTDKDTDNSTNNETPVNSTGTPSDNNDTSDETTNNKSIKDDTDDKHDDSDSNQDDSEAKRDDQAMANLIGNFAF